MYCLRIFAFCVALFLGYCAVEATPYPGSKLRELLIGANDTCYFCAELYT